MERYRWIIYIQQNIPCNISFELDRAPSLTAARAKFIEFCEGVMSDECSATLYPYSVDSWAEAEEFRDVGCPFDHPDRLIERGPLNGVIISNV